MGNLAYLQERLAAAFGAGPAELEKEQAEKGPLDVVPPVRPDDPLAVSRSERLPRFWLGGAGILASALLLAIGYALDATLAYQVVVAVAGVALLSIAAWRRPRHSREVIDASTQSNASPSGDRGDRGSDRDDPTRFFAVIHDALGDIAVTRSMDRRIVHANTTFRRVTGKESPEGMTCEELGLAFRPGAQPHRYDVEISTPNGQRMFVWHDIVTRDARSGRLMLQSIARDVTDDWLSSRAREEARQKAEYNNAAKSRLLATVSHEIRTPLSGILGMSHLLTQTAMTAEQANYLASIRQSGNALVQLVDDLLDFSTIEAGRFELRPRSESLRQLLESVVEMLAHRAHEKNIEIGAAVSPAVPEMMSFDPARLRQVLFNVIGNAVKFTQVGGVFVCVLREGGDLVIRVRDTGPGMSAEEQARIFAEFEQAGSSQQRSGGTGLGLTISARIMREFGGSLSVDSEKGIGSTFTIRFPAGIPADSRESGGRETLLKGSRVILLAPSGVASGAIRETITALGGVCHMAGEGEEVATVVSEMIDEGLPPTDIIVDHRVAPHFSPDIVDRLKGAVPGLRKIFLVNPEERSAHTLDLFDAWLIRPLREQSLIDVLRGRMRGMERRDALNDNQPGIGPALPEVTIPHAIEIVLAEDDPVNAMLVRAMLEKAGHAVQVVTDFEALYDRLTAQAASRPDVVISDLSMPGGDGLEMLGRIRGHERRHDLMAVPVIVLTADGRDETRRSALLNGANSVMAKPVDPERLLTDVQTLAALSQRRASVR